MTYILYLISYIFLTGNRRQAGCCVTVLFALMLLLSRRGAGDPGEANTAALAPPAVHAAAAIVINRDTGAALWAKNPDRRLPPASTTKIVTGFLLARDVPPETLISTSPDAARTLGHALGMTPGETFHAQDLLRAVLLASANDASVATAEHAAGREEAFAAQMNAWAQASGAANTHFANSTGLPAPNHYSTARDLALLARTALQNPVFADVVQTRTYSLPRSHNRLPTLLTNENALLWTVPGMEGVKAGWTQEAGFCFVGAVSRNGTRLITVVLNSPDWQRDTVALLNYGFALEGNREQGTGNRREEEKKRRREDKNVGAQFIAPAMNHALTTRNMSATNNALITPNTSATPNTFQSTVSGNNAQPPTSSDNRQSSVTNPPSSIEDRKSKIENSPDWQLPELRLPHNSSRDTITQNSAAMPVLAAGQRNNLQTSADGITPPTPPAAPLPWRALVLLLGALLAIGLFAGRMGYITMPDFLLALFGKRRKSESSSGLEAGGTNPMLARRMPVAAAPPEFRFNAPVLERRSGRGWLESVLDAPTRLLEPAVRRQARAILDADPRACESKTLALLHAPNIRLRLVGAELISGHAPRLAEETLLGIIKDETVGTDARTEAVQLLADMSGDRHERLWLQMLLRDGSAPAAAVLARLPRLEEASVQALKHVLTDGSEARPGDGDLKRGLRNAHIACVLVAHGVFTRVDSAPFLNAIPANHGEPIVVSTLRGTQQTEGVECLVELALRGHAYPALQALMETEPRIIRPILEAHEPELDRAERTRALILKWLLWGEGSEEQIQALATAGDDLARGALQLSRMHRHDPALAAPDALLAATQIYSLRLGFSEHAAGDIALAFRKAATDGEAQSLSLLPPELQPLAQVYAHPDVYEAAQFAMHAEDGLGAMLATLARNPANPQYRRELAFWCDKVGSEHRLLLTNALCGATETTEEEDMRTAIESRAADPMPLTRDLALRWLHAHPNYAPSPKTPLESNEQI